MIYIALGCFALGWLTGYIQDLLNPDCPKAQSRLEHFHGKPVWKQYALRNSMKGTVTNRREPITQKDTDES